MAERMKRIEPIEADFLKSVFIRSILFILPAILYSAASSDWCISG